MASERNWAAVPAQLFTSNGGRYGEVAVASTTGFKAKQKVLIYSNLITAPKILEVKAVLSTTDLILGPPGPEMSAVADLTAYTTATNATIRADKQKRPDILPDIYNRSVFEEEPTVAIRSFLVDALGKGYTSQNPLSVQLADGSVNIGTVNAELEVQLSHKDNDPNAGDVHDSVRIGDGVKEVNVTPANELMVSDLDTHTKLDTANTNLAAINTSTAVLHSDNVVIEGKLDTLHSDNVVIEGKIDSTNAKLDTANTNLTTIDTDLNTKLGSVTETAPVTDIASSGLNGRLQRIAQRITTLDGDITSFAAANHSDIVSSNSKLDTINTHLTNLETYTDGLETLIGTTNTELGGLTETAPITDTASSGLNGRLQRIAQRLTTLDTDLTSFSSTNHSDIVSSNSKLDSVNTHLTNLETYTDGLETLITSTNTKLDTINTSVTNGTQKTQIVSSGGVVASVNANGSLTVAGVSAVGIAPVNPPVGVSGVDGGGLKRALLTDTTGAIVAVGSAASATTDSGNPVKIGGVHKTTLAKLTAGQRGEAQVDENENLSVSRNEATYTEMQKTFSTTTTAALTVGTSETAIFLFKNPSGSTIKVKILKILLTGAATYRVYHTPTTSANGTALAAINQRIMTSPAAAAVTPFQSPTASVNGTLLFPVSVTAQGGTQSIPLDHQLIVDSNFNLLITALAGANNTLVNVTVFWCEVP